MLGEYKPLDQLPFSPEEWSQLVNKAGKLLERS